MRCISGSCANSPVSLLAKDFGPVWTGFYLVGAFGAGGGVLAETTLAGISVQIPRPTGCQRQFYLRAQFRLGSAGTRGLPRRFVDTPLLAGGYAGWNLLPSETANAGGSGASFSQAATFYGWTFGPSIEAMLTRNWATKLEYRYSQFGSEAIGSINMAPSTHARQAGLRYKFGDFGAAPSEDGPVFNEPAFN